MSKPILVLVAALLVPACLARHGLQAPPAGLDPDSASARAMRRSDQATRRSYAWTAVAAVAAVAGGTLVVLDPEHHEFDATVGVGLGLAAIAITAGILGAHHAGVAYEEDLAARRAYRDERLDACVDGLRLVACTTVTPR